MMRTRGRGLLTVIFLLLLVLAAACGNGGEEAASPPPEEPTQDEDGTPETTEDEATEDEGAEAVTLTVGELGIIADAPTYVALESGYFEEEDITVELERFRSAVDMVPLLSQGRLDAGVGTLSAGLYNALNRGLDIAIVADNARVAPGPDSHLAMVVRPGLEDEIQDYADLEGRTIAINAPAGGVEVELVKALEQGGLTLDDIELQTIPFPDMTPALENGSIDAAITLEPFLTLGQANDSFAKFKGVGEFYPDHQIAVLLYSPDLTERTDVAARFLRAYMRGVQDFRTAFLEGGGSEDVRTAVIDALVEHTPVTERSLYDQMAYQEVSADGRPNVDSIREDLEYYQESGEVEDPVDLDQYLNFDILESIQADLGE